VAPGKRGANRELTEATGSSAIPPRARKLYSEGLLTGGLRQGTAVGDISSAYRRARSLRGDWDGPYFRARLRGPGLVVSRAARPGAVAYNTAANTNTAPWPVR
jgi:hypothetical protein